ncbi:unnamed protein product [Aphanomyces euteiches]|uniref:Apple domain-containing protein n=1 Tax=Aphanomyces euteiches TaxID=100861 RepID=A0A6G0WEH1_9STRA|nr:hypothetical protein Ae201684_015695 [Aphanomyces euteiches]KAH9093858.1 hypothetical protein Ae201684P_016480 [Aphanomyces euteiches]
MCLGSTCAMLQKLALLSLVRPVLAACDIGITVKPSQCLSWEENVDYFGNDVAKFASITTPEECCDLCAVNPACKLYVVSIFGCSLKSAALNRRPDQDLSWNVRAAFRTASFEATRSGLDDDAYSPDIRVDPVAFTTTSGFQWYPGGDLESTESELEALIKTVNATMATNKHGFKPVEIITAAADGSLVMPFSSVESVGECAALVKSHDHTFFTYVPTSGMCLGHQFQSSEIDLYVETASGDTVALPLVLPNDFVVGSTSASDDDDCVAQCNAFDNCVAAQLTDQCTLYAPIRARSSSIVAGWVTSDFDANPVANLPTFEAQEATKVAFYVVAHEDDHELFMSNNYHVSIGDSDTKVVFVYTTAGDASSGDAWRQARELGTLAATTAWVDHVGLFDSEPIYDSATINGHTIAHVTVGNCVHYFMRVPEYGPDGASGFIQLVNNQKPVAPMDDTANYYQNRDDFKATLAGIFVTEADGISNIDMNAQDPLGEQPDHDMHLATGALVYDIVNEDAKWKICVPQKYFYDYQTWFNAVNVIPEVETLQRYAWLRLSQAIHAFDQTVLFWSEHSINLGRTYIRREINGGVGSCREDAVFESS